MAKTAKQTSKEISQQKRRRRQWITFLRMCRYGINNFTRNAWLTIAATAVMTITLLVVFVSVVAHQVLLDTVAQLRDKVNMSIYLETATTEQEAESVASELAKVPSVMNVAIISPEDARTSFVNQNQNDADTLDAVKEASNQFPWTLSIKVQDINDTSALANFVSTNDNLRQHIDDKRPPSFAGERRNSIESIGRAAGFAQQIGVVASAVFVIISMLIIFNTIRMAIFNRREEIQMMKLIGAERSFIRGPFVVEAMVYGFFAAIIASAIGYGLLVLAAPSLASYQIAIGPTLDLVTYYAGFVLLAMIFIGALIGIISSLLATQRYLKL